MKQHTLAISPYDGSPYLQIRRQKNGLFVLEGFLVPDIAAGFDPRFTTIREAFAAARAIMAEQFYNLWIEDQNRVALDAFFRGLPPGTRDRVLEFQKARNGVYSEDIGTMRDSGRLGSHGYPAAAIAKASESLSLGYEPVWCKLDRLIKNAWQSSDGPGLLFALSLADAWRKNPSLEVSYEDALNAAWGALAATPHGAASIDALTQMGVLQ